MAAAHGRMKFKFCSGRAGFKISNSTMIVTSVMEISNLKTTRNEHDINQNLTMARNERGAKF